MSPNRSRTRTSADAPNSTVDWPLWPALRSFIATRRSGDRKSTRLNSSHSQISYAVFCLKKKNSINLMITWDQKLPLLTSLVHNASTNIDRRSVQTYHLVRRLSLRELVSGRSEHSGIRA